MVEGVVVGEAEDFVAFGFEGLLALFVVVALVVVGLAVEFDDEVFGEAGEVDDVGGDGGLSAEFEVVEF